MYGGSGLWLTTSKSQTLSNCGRKIAKTIANYERSFCGWSYGSGLEYCRYGHHDQNGKYAKANWSYMLKLVESFEDKTGIVFRKPI